MRFYLSGVCRISVNFLNEKNYAKNHFIPFNDSCFYLNFPHNFCIERSRHCFVESPQIVATDENTRLNTTMIPAYKCWVFLLILCFARSWLVTSSFWDYFVIGNYLNMVCLPCVVIPMLLWVFYRFIQPYILKFWNGGNKPLDNKGQELTEVLIWDYLLMPLIYFDVILVIY